MQPLKRAAVLAFCAGAGAAFALLTVLWAREWWTSRPQPWTTNGFTATYDSANVEGDERTLYFSYVVENHTDSDFRVETDANFTIAARRQTQQDLTSDATSTVDLPGDFRTS
jgi:hypothetical protein